MKDEYDCNLEKCECAHFDEFFIGKSQSWLKLYTQIMNC